MGVPGFLNISSKKNSVYLVENGQPAPQPEFAPINRPRMIRSWRYNAKVVAIVDLLVTQFFWFPLFDVGSFVFGFVEALSIGDLPSFLHGNDVQSAVVIGLVVRFVASIILLIGTFRNSSWYVSPYLMVQMIILMGGPFMFVFVFLGYDPQLSEPRRFALCILMLPFLIIFIAVEYTKWRTVYSFYDTISSKNVSSEFAKTLDNEPKNGNQPQNQSILNAQSYLEQVYTSAQMQEMDPKEVESLLPVDSSEAPSKKYSFDNVKLELKE